MNIVRLINTVRYLKPVQVFYQVKYRLFKPKTLTGYGREADNPSTFPLRFFPLPAREPVLKVSGGGYSFKFLNQTITFKKTVDWSEVTFGKLWNYNLQYLDFLRQEDIAETVKTGLLLDLYGWMEKGDLPLEPYPVSLRIMNVIRFLTDNNLKEPMVRQCLYAEVAFLSKRPEYHLLGNHLLENGFALLMAGHFFKEAKWITKAEKLLKKELDEQVLEDGAHFELSPMYHQIILFRLLEALAYLREESGFKYICRTKAIKMVNWSKSMTFSNGHIPHFNDSTDGIAFSTVEMVDFAHQVGLSLDNNGYGLGDSGYRNFFLNDYECIADVAAIGPSYQPGHGHADALSFILHFRGAPLLVEAGTSTYTNEAIRNKERGTSSHNTVMVNGLDQSEVYGLFRVGKRAKVTILEEGNVHIKAQHNGYLHPYKLTHQRHFFFQNNQVGIHDFLQGPDPGSAVASFHFHPEVEVWISGDKVVMDGIGKIHFEEARDIEIESYSFSLGFNKTRTALVVRVRFEKQLLTTIEFQR